jgi:hypothetical protein
MYSLATLDLLEWTEEDTVADPTCKTVNPIDPNGPPIEAVFPGW